MKALIIVDMQNGCFAGEPPRLDREGLVTRINTLAGAVRRNGAVIHIRHTESADGFERGSDNWQFLPEMIIDAADHIVEKRGCDSFLETGLKDLLASLGIEEAIVVGCATDFCVDTTIRAASSHGFRVTAVSDGHTTRDRPHLRATDIITHHNYMWEDFLLPGGRRIGVVSTEMLVREMGEEEEGKEESRI